MHIYGINVLKTFGSNITAPQPHTFTQIYILSGGIGMMELFSLVQLQFCELSYLLIYPNCHLLQDVGAI